MKASESAADQDWRKKYFEALSSLENEQRNFKATEATLKRLAGRLCTASLGQSPRLDDEIKKLQAAIRREATTDELDKITPTLTDAIQSLDSKSPTPAVVPAPVAQQPSLPPEPKKGGVESRDAVVDDVGIRATLSALIAELRRDPKLIIQVDALDAMLSKAMTREQFPDVMSALTDIVGQRIKRIENAKQEVEVLLGQMVGKLDEIGKFVVDHTQNHSESLASSETLNVQLVGEMKAMGESVESGSDLLQIRSQVRSRLDLIGKHLQDFRERETTRSSAMQARNEQMKTRVAELEAEASRLHNQLKDEQRLSTIDALTKVPNRLAYEKRMDEELQRWQRFGQPTCVAVWDVDRFKSINDNYGHRAGDRVLAAVAECLAKRIRSTDFLARYGGEEFVTILSGTKLNDAARLMDEMRIAISKLGLHFKGTPLDLTISSGVTALQVGDSAAVAFERADKAMYQAKNGGRNRVVSA